jgi:hypothetical protein
MWGKLGMKVRVAGRGRSGHASSLRSLVLFQSLD